MPSATFRRYDKSIDGASRTIRGDERPLFVTLRTFHKYQLFSTY